MRGCGGGGGWEEGTRQWLTAHVFGVRRRDTSCGSRIKKLLGPGSDVDGDTAGVCNYDVSCRVCVCVCVLGIHDGSRGLFVSSCSIVLF